MLQTIQMEITPNGLFKMAKIVSKLIFSIVVGLDLA